MRAWCVSLLAVAAAALLARDAVAEFGHASYAELEVDGFGPAVVSLPRDAGHAKKPVVVAVHGHRHRPDWQCGILREMVGDRAFVLCPRGVKAPPQWDDHRERFTFGTIADTKHEIDAGLAALVRAYGADMVDTDHMVFYGHSLGAIEGAQIVMADPARFPRAILAEGGQGWSVPAARAFHAKGGERVLFGCGTPECDGAAVFAARVLEQAGAGAKVAYAEGAGHRSYGPIVDAMGAEIDWLLAGDPRF